MKKGTKGLKVLCVLLSLMLMSGMLAGCAPKEAETGQPEQQAVFPDHDINGFIMWGAGGGTDNVARTITPLAEKYLGKTVVLQNKTGATGAIATQFVHDQKSDGYTLLYGAENPQLYGVMEISKLSYSDFDPIILLGSETPIILVAADSKYNTMEELLDDAKANPGKIKLGTTGPGGLPFVVGALLKTVSDVEFNQVPYDGDGPVVTALLGGHVDATITKLSAAGELYKAGKVKLLASVSNDPLEEIKEIPPIGKILPDYQKYLPWGPFYGVFVKKDTPDDVKQVLKDAYKKAYEEQKFQDFMKAVSIAPMGITGAEAEAFLEKWQRVSTWLLYDAGGAKVSPETLGIKRVE